MARLNGSGSSSPDGDVLTYEWRENNTLQATGVTPSVSLGLGSHLIVLTVTDEHGATAQATVTVNVVDTTPPAVTCPGSITASAGTDSQATVPDITAGVIATDNCTAASQLVITQSPVAGTVVGSGDHVITVTVTDASTNRNTCTTTFTVEATEGKVTICHKGHTISISGKALRAHLDHGDSLGDCAP